MTTTNLSHVELCIRTDSAIDLDTNPSLGAHLTLFQQFNDIAYTLVVNGVVNVPNNGTFVFGHLRDDEEQTPRVLHFDHTVGWFPFMTEINEVTMQDFASAWPLVPVPAAA